MTIFKESGLLFEFSGRWSVLKYDEHRFYGYLSGSGFKGVDFIGILDLNRLALIEVKNYHDRFLTDKSKPTDSLLSDPIAFAEHYNRKFEDTFQLIDIIRRYYERKWWYRRLRLVLLKWIPRKQLLQTDWGFWTLVIHLIEQQSAPINLVLWLELPPELTNQQKEQFYRIVRTNLNQDFPGARYTICLADSDHPVLEFKGRLV